MAQSTPATVLTVAALAPEAEAAVEAPLSPPTSANAEAGPSQATQTEYDIQEGELERPTPSYQYNVSLTPLYPYLPLLFKHFS